MNALDLMASVRARGASLRVERDIEGAAVLVVAPRSRCVDLLPDLARYKPALLELLEPSVKGAPRVPDGLSASDIERTRLRLTKGLPFLMRDLSEDERLQLVVCTACHANGLEVPQAWMDWRSEANRNVTQ
jgi:hypothetical protein